MRNLEVYREQGKWNSLIVLQNYRRQKSHVITEEAAKTAFVLPFLQALGYDVFNPVEVTPEFTSDYATKKGEKVDYVIRIDGEIRILIECKPVGSPLEAKHAGQLFRYFSVTSARFAVLTDGIRYCFYSDLENKNKMDERPFFILDLENLDEKAIAETARFASSNFDLESILGTASNLKYQNALRIEILNEINDPSDELVRFLGKKVYDGSFTQQVKEKFTHLVKNAFSEVIRARVDARLKTALERGNIEDAIDNKSESETPDAEELDDDGIETTEDEIFAVNIIKAIAAEITDPNRVVMRDARSYCAVLFDNNNRKTIARLRLGRRKNSVGFFVGKIEERVDINKVTDIYKYKDRIISAVQQYHDQDS